jgi:hypothetical protein
MEGSSNFFIPNRFKYSNKGHNSNSQQLISAIGKHNTHKLEAHRQEQVWTPYKMTSCSNPKLFAQKKSNEMAQFVEKKAKKKTLQRETSVERAPPDDLFPRGRTGGKRNRCAGRQREKISVEEMTPHGDPRQRRPPHPSSPRGGTTPLQPPVPSSPTMMPSSRRRRSGPRRWRRRRRNNRSRLTSSNGANELKRAEEGGSGGGGHNRRRTASYAVNQLKRPEEGGSRGGGHDRRRTGSGMNWQKWWITKMKFANVIIQCTWYNIAP